VLERQPGPSTIISVGSSSKKSGKSRLAAFLVRELGADYGLKVSRGSHSPSPIVTDPELISRPGTDTGALVKAGAKKVIWVNASEGKLDEELRQALEMFPPGGVLVMEGNSALGHLPVDFAVFVMTVPFRDFKPSAETALSRADLVLVERRGPLSSVPQEKIEEALSEKAPGARVLFYSGEPGLPEALKEAARAARSATGLE
jgi:hypothetical protein